MNASQLTPRILLAGLLLCLLSGADADASKARVTARSGLNLRGAPSTRGRRILTLKRGETVDVVRTQGKWSYVRTARGSGWAWSSYLQGVPGETTRPRVRSSAGSARGLAGALRDPTGEGGASARGAQPRASTRGSTAPASTAAASTAAAPSTRGVPTRNLSGLHPSFRSKVERVLARLRAKGWQAHVAEGRRTVAQQREKVRRGYSRTMRSRHLTGNAADIVDRRYGWGGPAARQSYRFWTDLGQAARAEGLTWGGNWRIKDVAHVQQ